MVASPVCTSAWSRYDLVWLTSRFTETEPAMVLPDCPAVPAAPMLTVTNSPRRLVSSVNEADSTAVLTMKARVLMSRLLKLKAPASASDWPLPDCGRTKAAPPVAVTYASEFSAATFTFAART